MIEFLTVYCVYFIVIFSILSIFQFEVNKIPLIPDRFGTAAGMTFIFYLLHSYWKLI